MIETGQFDTGFGVLIRGMLVIDVDARNGGVESMALLANDYPSLKKVGMIVKTGSGGGSRHFYFKLPEEMALVQHLDQYPGIDFKSSGFVVGPGSLHASGNRYEVSYGSVDQIEDAPEDIIALLRKPDRHRAVLNGYTVDVSHQELADMLAYVPPDTDHDTWVKCGMAVHHASNGTAFDVWDAWSAKGSKYPGPDVLQKRWHSFGKATNPVTLATLKYYAEHGGWLEPVTFTPNEEIQQALTLEFQPSDNRIVDDSSKVTMSGYDWPEPEPLFARTNPAPYPLDALPTGIKSAVQEVAGFVKAPVAMIASSAFGAMSLAIQHRVDVKRAENLSGPVSLFSIVIADSGERKSSCDNYFTKSIHLYQEESNKKAISKLNAYAAAIQTWEIKHKALKAKIQIAAQDGLSTDEGEAELKLLLDKRPESPRIPRLIYSDTTSEALSASLSQNWPSGGIMSSEAGLVFGGHGMSKDAAMRTLSLYNVLWDGGSLQIDRKTSESFTIENVRLTVNLQVQGATLRDFLLRTGELARGTGFLARFLLCSPESTQGSRLFTEPPFMMSAVEAFNDRLYILLDQSDTIDRNGVLKTKVIKFSDDAKVSWIEFHDRIEKQLAVGGNYQDVRDVASKIADNAARLAALIHVFEGNEGPISKNAFDGAEAIVQWHLDESCRFFNEVSMSPELANAVRVERWLVKMCQHGAVTSMRRNVIRQKGPVRDLSALNAAISELVKLGRIRNVKDGRTEIVVINPHILNSKTN